jgi:hypothetical protein
MQPQYIIYLVIKGLLFFSIRFGQSISEQPLMAGSIENIFHLNKAFAE